MACGTWHGQDARFWLKMSALPNSVGLCAYKDSGSDLHVKPFTPPPAHMKSNQALQTLSPPPSPPLPPFPLRGLNLFSWFRLRSFSRDPPRVVTSGPGPCMLGSPGPTALVGGYIWWWPPGWVDLWGKNYGSTPQPTQEKQGREAKLS